MTQRKSFRWLLIAAAALHTGMAWAQSAPTAAATSALQPTWSSTIPSAAPAVLDVPDPSPNEAPSRALPSSAQPTPSTDVNAAFAAAPAKSTKSPAQEAPETLLGPHYKLGGFGGLGVMYTRFAKTDAVQVCGEGAVLLNHVFSIGLGGCGITRMLKTTSFDAQADPDHRTSFGYGGGLIRYHFYSHRFVNLAIATLVGAGGIASGDWQRRNRSYSEEDIHPDFVFVFEPQMAGFVNVTRWLRIGATAGYRFVASSDTVGLSSSDLAAPTIGGQIQAGWF